MGGASGGSMRLRQMRSIPVQEALIAVDRRDGPCNLLLARIRQKRVDVRSLSRIRLQEQYAGVPRPRPRAAAKVHRGRHALRWVVQPLLHVE